ncbi:MAG: (d)CMP kinase [Alphaproteobacteria bacterium]|nr:(d)CMP kinase [Alphaproteobacteria bacterium]
MPPSFVIAIDGPTASGKGTLAKRLARHLGFAHLDSGLLYRAVGLALLRSGRDSADKAAATAAAQALDPSGLSDPTLRSEETGKAASVVATIPEVRAALLDFQRRFAASPPGGAPGAVLDGRDIGSVVCPDARAKIFLDAGVEERAARREKELRDRGAPIIEGAVLRDLQERDARDRNRAVAPLIRAGDAYVLDTTGMDADQAFAKALAYVRSRGFDGSGVPAVET